MPPVCSHGIPFFPTKGRRILRCRLSQFPTLSAHAAGPPAILLIFSPKPYIRACHADSFRLIVFPTSNDTLSLDRTTVLAVRMWTSRIFCALMSALLQTWLDYTLANYDMALL